MSRGATSSAARALLLLPISFLSCELDWLMPCKEMAKREEPKPSKSKMTVMFFQLEGSDETLREGLDKIGEAIGSAVKIPLKQIAPPKVIQGAQQENGDDESAVTGEDEAPDQDAPDSGDDDADRSSATTSRKRSLGRSPKVVDLNTGSASIPIDQYFKLKNGDESISRTYLVIALWLKDELKKEPISMDEIHTCLKLLKMSTPVDAGQPLRDLKSQGFMEKVPGVGLYKINHVGENRVNHPK